MYEMYMVKEGDTLDDIASKFKVSTNIISNINNGTDFKTNQIIKIPKQANKYFDYYVIDKGDTLYKIANDNNIDSFLLAQLNGLNISDYIYPGQVLLVPKAGSIIYFTAVGDTLVEIAKGLNISVDELLKENNNVYLQPEQLIVYKYK